MNDKKIEINRYNKKANQDAANAGSASAEEAAKSKTQELHLFFQICQQLLFLCLE